MADDALEIEPASTNEFINNEHFPCKSRVLNTTIKNEIFTLKNKNYGN
jgi:hypothetical protein